MPKSEDQQKFCIVQTKSQSVDQDGPRAIHKVYGPFDTREEARRIEAIISSIIDARFLNILSMDNLPCLSR